MGDIDGHRWRRTQPDGSAWCAACGLKRKRYSQETGVTRYVYRRDNEEWRAVPPRCPAN